jgi:hypothetical protein
VERGLLDMTGVGEGEVELAISAFSAVAMS